MAKSATQCTHLAAIIAVHYIRLTGLEGSRWPHHPKHSPQHCWNFARGVPRLETWVFQARVPNVRQAKETRPNPLDPRFARGQRPNPHHRLHLQPCSHWNLWHIQEQRKARSIVNYFIQKSKQNFIISAIYEQNQEEQNLSVVGRLTACLPAWWSKMIWLLLLNLKNSLSEYMCFYLLLSAM